MCRGKLPEIGGPAYCLDFGACTYDLMMPGKVFTPNEEKEEQRRQDRQEAARPKAEASAGRKAAKSVKAPRLTGGNGKASGRPVKAEGKAKKSELKGDSFDLAKLRKHPTASAGWMRKSGNPPMGRIGHYLSGQMGPRQVG